MRFCPILPYSFTFHLPRKPIVQNKWRLMRIKISLFISMNNRIRFLFILKRVSLSTTSGRSLWACNGSTELAGCSLTETWQEIHSTHHYPKLPQPTWGCQKCAAVKPDSINQFFGQTLKFLRVPGMVNDISIWIYFSSYHNVSSYKLNCIS